MKHTTAPAHSSCRYCCFLGGDIEGDLIQGLSPLAASRPQSHVRLSVQVGVFPETLTLVTRRFVVVVVAAQISLRKIIVIVTVDVVMMQPYKFEVEQGRVPQLYTK